MSTSAAPRTRAHWGLLVTASAMLMLTMGARQTTGLFVEPIHRQTGIGIASISFALAIGQLVWGAVQPVFGAIADQRGPLPVLMFGGVLLAAGLGLAPWWTSEWGLIVSLGVLAAAGAGAGSFSVLIGATAHRIAPERRSFAAGLINAGGSLGQFVFAPLVQLTIGAAGWAKAMTGLALVSLLTLPLAWPLRRVPSATGAHTGAVAGEISLRAQLQLALRDRSYWCLHLGFFTCGVHIAFLVTHLPGEVALCGLPASVSAVSIALIGLFNVAGSLTIGKLGERVRMKWLLTAMYASRAVMIGLYLIAPPTPLTFYLFAAGLGFTWLAMVPPTAGLIGKLFGPRYLGTLFGLMLLSHQLGGFFGAWLGGLALEHSGNYLWMWYGDIVLAVAAALVNLPIREAVPVRHVAVA
ncbi:MFS transporter [Xanthomonas campestris pv. campestris]|uniref:MFS transporter n=1 Tax=Xanthomonas campestris TaxID=339 RepID=UPI002368E0EC|nr:MFS transporter [Xanthomonas campestris]MDO0847591.1 MFS transporter [Xanthomonas campestris pv. campestris]MDO0865023.1 MFS transporter [Xanthomonas campestris pv. campestris]MEB1204096.1 MFS transporter [Xanthomonas campestris pv. campestris]MEB1241541.1 MFS transporter [Xanthomonas campestris pv. campestris]MEB1412207.1 MFS transporter [Xanthomonas campestris pv. campestris]